MRIEEQKMRKTGFMLLCAVLSLVLHASDAIVAESVATDSELAMRFQNVGGIVKEKCMACHTKGYELPFYAKIPGIKDIIERDYRDGLRAMDLRVELVDLNKDQPVGESTIAKMEWVVKNNTMPPAKFTAVHWGTSLSDQDKKDILEWVKTTRAEYYASKGMAEKHANEPVQMIVPVEYDANKADLGKKLFNDKRLSTDDTISCASCHDFAKGGTDNLRFSEGVRKQFGDINAPTVFNAVYNVAQFWNGRAADLQDQAGGPPLNPIEMASKDWNEIITKLSKDADLTAAFKAVYPAGWNAKNITDAIAEYEKTLITPNSAFDKWLAGDDNAISAEAKEGYERFKAYRCASCHVGKALGGQSFEFMDLKKDYFADRGEPLGSDSGLQGFTKKDEDLHKFKTPNLRNIELTAPYLHDGTITTLDEAVRIMGIYLSGLEVSPTDRAKIVAFLRTLTGEFEGKLVGGTAVAK